MTQEREEMEVTNEGNLNNSAKVQQKHFYTNVTFWTLLLTNLAVIVWAVWKDWALAEIIWIYWIQSVGIGIFWFIRILSLKEFSTKDFTLDYEKPVPETVEGKGNTAAAFLFSYSFFIIFYGTLIISILDTIPTLGILLAGLAFLCEQIFSFNYKKDQPTQQKPNIGNMVLCPHLRALTVPVLMLLAKSEGGDRIFEHDSVFVLIVFLLLKTFIDMVMYSFEERGFADDPILDGKADSSTSSRG